MSTNDPEFSNWTLKNKKRNINVPRENHFLEGCLVPCLTKVYLKFAYDISPAESKIFMVILKLVQQCLQEFPPKLQTFYFILKYSWYNNLIQIVIFHIRKGVKNERVVEDKFSYYFDKYQISNISNHRKYGCSKN